MWKAGKWQSCIDATTCLATTLGHGAHYSDSTPRNMGNNDGMDMWVWIPVHKTYIPIENLLLADSRHEESITESVNNMTIKLGHNSSTSSRPDHFHPIRTLPWVSRHHSRITALGFMGFSIEFWPSSPLGSH